MPYTNLIGRSAANPPAMAPDDVSALIREQVGTKARRATKGRRTMAKMPKGMKAAMAAASKPYTPPTAAKSKATVPAVAAKAKPKGKKVPMPPPSFDFSRGRR